MRREIDFRLFPDILFEGYRYSNYDECNREMKSDCNIPFLRAYSDAKENRKILLLGDGSLGKSTSLRIFEAECLYQQVACVFYECKKINASDIKAIESVISDDQIEILIFDAYDELQTAVRDEFNEVIDKLNHCQIRVIVSSRFNPQTLSEAAGEIFSAYKQIFICDFSHEQLDSLVDETISRTSGYYSLLKNTMFLDLHLELEKNNLLKELRESIKTEAEFIQQYFELLYLDKTDDEVMLCDLIHLGEYIHKQRRGFIINYQERIPNPLNHIFSYEPTCSVIDETQTVIGVTSIQIKYLDYLHGLYLKELLIFANENIRDNSQYEAFLIDLFNIPSTSENSESIYYAGQLLAEYAGTFELLRILNRENIKKKTRYENILCLFLGYNQDIADDIPNVFVFYHPIMEEKHHDYIYVCDRIRELRANSLRSVSFGHSGFTQLEVIAVDNDLFYSQGNCLIRKSKHGYNGLYIGCRCSTIPESVIYIYSQAFSHCNIKEVLIPDSVREVDRYAFKYCEMLEYVELGQGVEKVAREAFYKCRSIKTIRMKNNRMRLGHEEYDWKSFEGISKLTTAIVPTTAVPLIYRIACTTLEHLEIFQGYGCSGIVRMTLDCINSDARWNTLRELVVASDIEEISEEAFIQLGNALEKITVDDGCDNYYSVDNCLISKRDETLVLGCKNSRIPEIGVKRIKSYAFARCSELEHIVIPENINQIGYNCFQQCFGLNWVHFKCLELRAEDRAFIACRNLKKVVVDHLNSWVNYKFSDVTSNPLCFASTLECVDVVGDTLDLRCQIEAIEQGAFRRFNGFKKVLFPNTIKQIGGCAFFECNALSEVHIENISSWALIQFTSFSSNPLYLGAQLFCNNEEITTIAFEPNSKINKFAFVRTPSINTIRLSSGCCVGEQSFDGCPNLREVILDDINVNIHPTAFRGCNINITVNGSRSEWEKMTKGQSIEGVSSISIKN